MSIEIETEKSCNWELNSGPLPYQGSALPLSYYSVAMRAENGAQTRDPQLGRLVLYQLSYFRKNSFRMWVVMDSNHRRHSQQIYSLPHLATLVTTLFKISLVRVFFNFPLSLLSDSNQRPRDYKSRALANWAKEANPFSRYDFTRTCSKTAAKIRFIF